MTSKSQIMPASAEPKGDDTNDLPIMLLVNNVPAKRPAGQIVVRDVA